MRTTIRVIGAVAAAAVVMTGAVALSGGAQAADNGRWSVFPTARGNNSFNSRPYFIFNASTGQVIHDSATISNFTLAPLPLDVYPADAFDTKAGGAFAVGPESAPRTGVGAWTKVGTDHVVVPAAKRNKAGKIVKAGTVQLPITIDVPSSATPGDHAGALVTIDASPLGQLPTEPGGGNTSVRIRQANAARIYVRVQGPLTPQLLVTNVSFVATHPAPFPLIGPKGSATVRFTLVNAGNVRLSPRGDLRLSGLFGQTITSVPLPVPEILPGQSAVFQQAVQRMPAFDRVTATVTLADPAVPASKASGSTSTWSISWIFLLVLLVIALLVGGYYWRRRRSGEPSSAGRRRAVPAGPGGASVP